jgi:hypothetical protein
MKNMTSLPGRLLSVAVLVIAGTTFAWAQGMTIRSGHAGHWYSLDRSGEGWVLELRDAGNAWLYWFTYDGQGRQRWLTAAGQVVPDGDGGQRIDFPQLVVTRGARFGAAFDPDDVVREDVGSASFRFDDCDNGQFSYSAFNQSGSFNVQRLAHVMGTRCETPHGVTGREVAGHAGQSGSWYDLAHNGEGYALHWSSPNQAIVTWYSYDGQGNQYWMLGTGQLDAEGRIHFPDVHATRGARFGAAFDPDDVERFAWGELTFELACDGGSASYASVLPSFGAGAFDLTRLTSLHEVACPWQRPKLIDLYELSFTELQVDHGPFVAHIEVQNISDDGLIVATRKKENGRSEVLKATVDKAEWEVIADQALRGMDSFALISPDGSSIFSTRHDSSTVRDAKPSVWSEGVWSLIDEAALLGARMDGASPNRSVIVGRKRNETNAGDHPWKWRSSTGIELLGVSDEIGGGTPRAASDDGGVVVGITVRLVNGMPRRPAVRWVDDQPPELLRDNDGHELAWALSVSSDGGLVFGVDQVVPSASHPNAGQAWWWQAPGRMAYLGTPDDAVIDYYAPFWVADVTHDGNMVVGSYANDQTAGSDAYIWTQHTGIVRVSRILHESGIASDWTSRSAVSVTTHGDRILLSGRVEATRPGELSVMRAAVIRLMPRNW